MSGDAWGDSDPPAALCQPWGPSKQWAGAELAPNVSHTMFLTIFQHGPQNLINDL